MFKILLSFQTGVMHFMIHDRFFSPLIVVRVIVIPVVIIVIVVVMMVVVVVVVAIPPVPLVP